MTLRSTTSVWTTSMLVTIVLCGACVVLAQTSPWTECAVGTDASSCTKMPTCRWEPEPQAQGGSRRSQDGSDPDKITFTRFPTHSISRQPTTAIPSKSPLARFPSFAPVFSRPSQVPTSAPTPSPLEPASSVKPSASPSESPTIPSNRSSSAPSQSPSLSPFSPIAPPEVRSPSSTPSSVPSRSPSTLNQTDSPKFSSPSFTPSITPNSPFPSLAPTVKPTLKTSVPSGPKPSSRKPTLSPTKQTLSPTTGDGLCIPKCTMFTSATRCPSEYDCEWRTNKCLGKDSTMKSPTRAPVAACRSLGVSDLPMDLITSLTFSPKPGDRLVVTTMGHTQALLFDTGDIRETWSSRSPIAWLEGHHGNIVKVAFSADGTKVATCSIDRSARVFDTSDGRFQFALEGEHTAPCVDVAFPSSSQLRFIVTASHDGTALLWDADTGELTKRLMGHREPLSAAAFSPKNLTSLATAGYDGRVRLWNALDGTIILDLDHREPVYAMRFSPNGELLLGASTTISIWNATTGDLLHKLVGHADIVTTIAFAPERDYLLSLAVEDFPILWDLSSGSKLYTFETGNLITALAFNHDGRILTIADDLLSAWDPMGLSVQSFEAPRKNLMLWAVAPHVSDSLLFTGGSNGSLTLWQCP